MCAPEARSGALAKRAGGFAPGVRISRALWLPRPQPTMHAVAETVCKASLKMPTHYCSLITARAPRSATPSASRTA